MEIKVLFEGMPILEGLKSGDTVTVEEGETVSDLLLRYNVRKEFHDFVILLVNGEHQDVSYVFRDKDELKLFVPVSGG